MQSPETDGLETKSHTYGKRPLTLNKTTTTTSTSFLTIKKKKPDLFSICKLIKKGALAHQDHSILPSTT